MECLEESFRILSSGPWKWRGSQGIIFTLGPRVSSGKPGSWGSFSGHLPRSGSLGSFPGTCPEALSQVLLLNTCLGQVPLPGTLAVHLATPRQWPRPALLELSSYTKAVAETLAKEWTLQCNTSATYSISSFKLEAVTISICISPQIQIKIIRPRLTKFSIR